MTEYIYTIVFETDVQLDPKYSSLCSADCRPLDPWVGAVLNSSDVFSALDSTTTSKNLERATDHQSVEPSKGFKEHTSPDWRFGKVDLVGVDMVPESSVAGREASSSPDSAGTQLKSTFLGYGVVKLYRENTVELPEETSVSTDDGTVVAILAVPGYMSATDLIEFVDKDTREHASHFRMVVSSGVPDRYMVLIKFREPRFATNFYMTYNGKQFNSMEAETCHVVYVKSVEFRSHIRSVDDIPYLLEDPFTGSPRKNLRELPTCPVCLERMDANVTGLLTILCQHTFHCQCLQKWGDGSCPVCRHRQKTPAGDRANPLSSNCAVCEAGSNLWACLICGHVGCGRYDQAHAYDHFVTTGHCFAMDISTQRIWDYSSDGYVHRLIQNQSDGKLVELPSEKKKDIDDVGLQYTYLMTTQLESQRDYYESMCATVADSAAEATKRAEAAERELEKLREQLDKAGHDKQQLRVLYQELEQSKTKHDKLKQLYLKLEKDFRDEKAMSSNVMEKLGRIEKERDAQDKNVQDLTEQIRDLMFFLDAKEKLADADEEVREGTLVMGKKTKGKRGLRK
jgi:BRCA1-associated protein